MDEKPVYLGDGVYALYDGYQIVLYANDPNNPTDTIAIEQYTWLALLNYSEKIWGRKGGE